MLASSCAKDALPETDIVTVSPTLKFENLNEMIDYYSITNEEETFSNNASLQLDSEFKSFKAIYRAAVEEISEAESDEQYNQLLSEYSDILSIIDSTYTPKITNHFYQTICNRDGIYESDGYAHKVIDSDLMIITKVENVNELKEIHLESSLASKSFSVVSYTGNEDGVSKGKQKRNCGDYLEKEYFSNKRKCKKDRTINVSIQGVRIYSSPYYYLPYISFKVWGEKRTWRCNWKSYRTILDTRNCSFEGLYTKNGITSNHSFTFPNVVSENSYGKNLLSNPLGSTMLFFENSDFQFTKVNLEATSRGVGDNWVILNCQ